LINHKGIQSVARGPRWTREMVFSKSKYQAITI